MSKCGFEVRSYEPDPQHFDRSRRNLALNGCSRVDSVNAAISSRSGVEEFVKVLGNTLGGHLAGSKPNPYGELERFPVNLEPIQPIIGWADFVELDFQGHEKKVLLSTGRGDWENTDAMIEVGAEGNAEAIYHHLRTLGVR